MKLSSYLDPKLIFTDVEATTKEEVIDKMIGTVALYDKKVAAMESLYRTKDVLTIDRKGSIMEVCFLLVNKGKTRIYVVENGVYYGMIQRCDIIKKVLHI